MQNQSLKIKSYKIKYKLYLRLVFLCLFGFILGNYIIHRPLDLNKNPGYIFNITPKENLKSVLNRLKQDRILSILDCYALNLYAKFTGLDRKIKIGEYLIVPKTTGIGLIKQFTVGKVLLHKFTIVEGLRYEQTMEYFKNHPAIEHTLTSYTCRDLLKNIDRSINYIVECDGLFMPDTYLFPRGTKDTVILQKAYDMMQTRLNDLWDNTPNKEQGILKSSYDVLIMASIIEKETSLVQEMKRVSGVYHKRLHIGIPLQADPTVIYGLKIFERPLTRADLKIPSKYNTYLNRGLPPAPIATPSVAAIFAALNPSKEEYLYFVADGSGGHVFSNSLLEHNQAVQRIRSNRNTLTVVNHN